MFWKKKPEADPLGVPLSTLLLMLKPTTIKARREGNAIVADHGAYTTRVEVVPPEDGRSADVPIQAVVRVTAGLPKPLGQDARFQSAEAAAALNAFASLGAVTTLNGQACVGSRLTIYQGEGGAWPSLHLPLLAFTVIGGVESIVGGLRRSLAGQSGRDETSNWTDADLDMVQEQLSQICVCKAGRGGLTAEFGLTGDAVSAVAGDRNTALFELATDDGHPEFGGGLLSLLHLPHRIGDLRRIQELCAKLNQMEMAAKDQPPHFGAWCPGRRDGLLAYVTFLPNALHSVRGIALNVAVWAAHRARWASGALTSLGVQS